VTIRPPLKPVALFVLPTLHLAWCLAIETQIIPQSEGSWTWFFVFVVDFPSSILPAVVGNILDTYAGISLPEFVAFGITGTIWWYLVSWFLLVIVNGVRESRASRP
jgi:hypothetical protein